MRGTRQGQIKRRKVGVCVVHAIIRVNNVLREEHISKDSKICLNSGLTGTL